VRGGGPAAGAGGSPKPDFFGFPDPYLSCPVCVSRPIRVFNRSKIVVEKGKQVAEKGKEAKTFFSDPKNLKLFQQYLKASAHLPVYFRSSSLTLFLEQQDRESPCPVVCQVSTRVL
jgi:hypothetical protein